MLFSQKHFVLFAVRLLVLIQNTVARPLYSVTFFVWNFTANVCTSPLSDEDLIGQVSYS